MTERINAPRDREALVADFAELRAYGVDTEEAARRVGLTDEQIANHFKAAHMKAKRRAKVVGGGVL